jgi:hypothetical protein
MRPRTLHPERFHGFHSRRPFFEGWYYKLVSGDERERWAVIPGLFRGADPASDHAFVQVLDGSTGGARYHAFPVGAFRAARDASDVRVGASRFGPDRIALDIADAEGSARGEVILSGTRPWPVGWASPGIMGWYAWVPFMECYHGVVSLDHALSGTLEIDGVRRSFDGGRGYGEKDWGQAFPSAYVWMQSNHFAAPGTSLTASVAMNPWIGHAFRGFLAGLLHEGVLHRFATYTGARIEELTVDHAHVTWSIRDRRRRLALRAHRAAGGLLRSPVRTEMHRRVEETLLARVEVRLTSLERGGERGLFAGEGRCAGLEVHGDLPRLLRG